jgi:HlyD family secretion protein
MPMTQFTAPNLSRILLTTLLCLACATPSLAADDPDAPKGAAVTVLKAAKSCFDRIVEVSGIVIPREETSVRPDRPGLKVAEIMADAGLVSASTAQVGAVASGRGEALFSIIARSEFDLVGLVPTQDLGKLAANQTARIKILGAGEVDGKVRRVASTVEPNSQLGQVFVGVTTTRKLLANSSGRAMIKTGQSCGVSVPLTAVLYGNGGTVVQVIRRARVETKRVEVGLMSGGQVEVREGLVEGDIVVARAGALLREGDPVRPVTVSVEGK